MGSCAQLAVRHLDVRVFPAFLVSPSARSPHPAASLPPLYPPARDALIPQLPCLPFAKGGGAATPEERSLPGPLARAPSARCPHSAASLPPVCKGWWRGSAGGMVAPPGPLARAPARDALILPLPCLPCIPQHAIPSSRSFPASLVQRVMARQRRRDGRSPGPSREPPSARDALIPQLPASLFMSGQNACAPSMSTLGRLASKKSIPTCGMDF